MYICLFVYMHVVTYVYFGICIFSHMCIFTYVYVDMYVCFGMCICMYVLVCAYVDTWMTHAIILSHASTGRFARKYDQTTKKNRLLDKYDGDVQKVLDHVLNR